jgi:hypothetical protein
MVSGDPTVFDNEFFDRKVEMKIEGFDDDEDLCMFSLEEDMVPNDVADECPDSPLVDETWSWASAWGTAKLRHDSLDSRSTCESTPPPSFVGSLVLHACLEELREKRVRCAA